MRRADLRRDGRARAELDALGRRPPRGWLVDPGAGRALERRLARRRCAAHDAADPLDPGLPLEAAAARRGLPDTRLVEPVLRLAERRPTCVACATAG